MTSATMEQDKPEAKIPEGVDPQMYHLVVAAIKDNVLARTLSQEDISKVACEAIHEGKISDPMWLTQRIRRLRKNLPIFLEVKFLRSPSPNEQMLPAVKTWIEFWNSMTFGCNQFCTPAKISKGVGPILVDVT